MPRTHSSAAAALAAALVLVALLPGSAAAEAVLASAAPGAAPPNEASFDMDVSFEGVVARVRTRQTLVHDGAAPAQALYSFDLPVDAAVIGVSVHSPGSRRSSSALVDADAAVAAVADPAALSATPDPALLRLVARDAPGIDGDTDTATATYELLVYPLLPGQATTVTIEWLAPLRYDDGRLRLRVPARGHSPGLVREDVSLRLAPPPGVRGFSSVHGGSQALGRDIRRARFRAAPRGDLIIEATLDFGGSTQPVLGFARVPLPGAAGAVAVAALSPLPRGEHTLGYERVLLVLDVSRSLERAGLAAADAVVGTLLANIPAQTQVEAVLFDRTPRRLFQRFRDNSAEVREQITAALRPDALANGSDLGAALEMTRQVLLNTPLPLRPAEGLERGHHAATLVVLVTDGMTPLALTPRRALDRLGRDVLADASIAAVTLVPDEAPAPASDEGALALLARKSSGRAITVRLSEATSRAQALGAALSRPAPLTEVDIDLGRDRGVRLDGIDIPSVLEPGQGFVALGLFRGPLPETVELSALAQGRPLRIGSRRDEALARACAPLALVRPLAEDSPVWSADAEGAARATEESRRRLVAAARQAGVVTRVSSLVAVDGRDRFARDRLNMTRNWGPSAFLRMPPPAERDGYVHRAFKRRVVPDVHAVDTPPRRTGQLDRHILERLLARHVKPLARACYQDALRRDPKLAGSMLVALELARGEVQLAEIERSTFPQSKLEACVIDAAYRIPVPRVALGDDPETIHVVRYPLELRRRNRSIEVHSDDSAEESRKIREILNSHDPLDGLEERR
ncbi:VWA domain-containing protein [Haliangium ochraceum]|uniref:von Willebrand factor type A n=1 Tax=Haliangium ochraceum (strain DSM 14365 / JCM 11303 / SMP-2) TaxID=502025 RepID=D0LJS9_HALO1|nr:VWA domain-containing protein [Haliangium ochraceum]ACY18436.1 von Willebrand factor type A [Haliangium ochraceum DSM 14365]